MISEKKIDEYGTIRYFKPGTDILHNEHGPAIEYSDGHKSWYVDGFGYSEEEYWKHPDVIAYAKSKECESITPDSSS